MELSKPSLFFKLNQTFKHRKMKMAIKKSTSVSILKITWNFIWRTLKNGHPDDQHSPQGAEDQQLPENLCTATRMWYACVLPSWKMVKWIKVSIFSAIYRNLSHLWANLKKFWIWTYFPTNWAISTRTWLQFQSIVASTSSILKLCLSSVTRSDWKM